MRVCTWFHVEVFAIPVHVVSASLSSIIMSSYFVLPFFVCLCVCVSVCLCVYVGGGGGGGGACAYYVYACVCVYLCFLQTSAKDSSSALSHDSDMPSCPQLMRGPVSTCWPLK